MKKNKNLFGIVIFIILPLLSYSQTNWVGYIHAVNIAEYEGHHFRLQGTVRAEVADDSASARLFARVDKKNGMGFFDNMWYRPIRSKKWKTYTIEGNLDSGSYQIVFGALCQYNGKFFYDDIKIDIETEENQWKNVYSADFENKNSDFVKPGQGRNNGSNEFYQSEIIKDDVARDNQCLLIVGNGVPNFGINNEAGKYADVNGIKLYYEVYGDGQPLVVLHGNGGSIEDAAPMYPHFIDKGYKIIAVDSRAQGRSGDTDAELTYELLASDVNELLDQLNIDSVYLWGQSDGAIVGLIMTLDYPEKIKKLVAFGPNIIPDSTAIIPRIYHSIEKNALTAEDFKVQKLACLMWQHPNIPIKELNKIQSEVLLMSGDHDFITLNHMVDIFKNIPKVQLCVLPGSTHNASWEKTDLFLEIVDDFLEKPFWIPNTKAWFED